MTSTSPRKAARARAAGDARSVTHRSGLVPMGLGDVLAVGGTSQKRQNLCADLPRRASAESGSATRGPAESLGFSPMVDGHYIPAHPYDPVAPEMSEDVPLIVGINRDETLFMNRGNPEVASMDDAGLRKRLEPTHGSNVDRILEVYRHSRPEASPAQLYIAITTAQWMWMNAVTLAERKVALGAAPVFMYIFAFDRDAPRKAGRSDGGGACGGNPLQVQQHTKRRVLGRASRAYSGGEEHEPGVGELRQQR